MTLSPRRASHTRAALPPHTRRRAHSLPPQTGVCDCDSSRAGADCSQPNCQALFDALCEECTADECTRAAVGHFVDNSGGAGIAGRLR
jgi:hypothetical protein